MPETKAPNDFLKVLQTLHWALYIILWPGDKSLARKLHVNGKGSIREVLSMYVQAPLSAGTRL